ncbi:hypothetical protein [Bacillus cereus]|uniref:hypothetical protein n=1 Tax=Bacillus cereus TaxID=1396 RepID=UPI00027C0829|nr:hypothetical protein [Bacillus cereus]EJV54866.1 hypothetical protein IEM_05813 [Bacillus cereus BAG6O-2]
MSNDTNKNVQQPEVEEKVAIVCQKMFKCCETAWDCAGTLHQFPSGKVIFQYCGCSGS